MGRAISSLLVQLLYEEARNQKAYDGNTQLHGGGGAIGGSGGSTTGVSR